jgi:hypothetical protein
MATRWDCVSHDLARRSAIDQGVLETAASKSNIPAGIGVHAVYDVED